MLPANMGSTRFTLLTLFTLSASASLVLAACSTGNDDEGNDPTSSSTGSGGADGGAGGSGGSGGGGGEYTGPCDQDCSKIEPPQCYQSVCNEGAYPGPINVCTVIPISDVACDDGLFCTVADTCNEGMCIGGPQNTCDSRPDQCSIVSCDEATKTCSNTTAADGAPCVDDDLCMVNGKCQNAECVGTPKDCGSDPLAACNTMACNPETGACEGTPDAAKDGASCSFGELCNDGTTCDNGACTGGTPKDCSGLSVGCLNGVCNPQSGLCTTEPVADGEACLDGNDECNVGMCDINGQCQPVPTPGIACPSAADDCNVGTCSAAGACEPVPANEGGGCSDGNSCTTGETCTAGACTGGVMGGYELYFNETFASNSAGWTLGPEWQIGSAMTSSGQDAGNPDPAMDHTDTGDNGIAGIVIGGNAQDTVSHDYEWLTSPAFDTSGAAGSVYLEFWRWLNSDYTPFMVNAVEVWNGSAWINIWMSGGSPAIQDAAWTKIVHDITAYKNAQMQVRFGMATPDVSGLWLTSNWNLDDVVVANQSCN
jgi:hypothetical protein